MGSQLNPPAPLHTWGRLVTLGNWASKAWVLGDSEHWRVMFYVFNWGVLGWCGEQGRGIYVGGLMGFEGSGCGGDEEVDNGEDCAGGKFGEHRGGLR